MLPLGKVLPVFQKDDKDWLRNIKRGAYIVKEAKETVKRIVVATGSEVVLALKAINRFNSDGSFDDVRIISMPDRERFYSQSNEYINQLIPENASVMVVEAGIKMGWERIALAQNILAINRFGESGPAEAVARFFKFTEEEVVRMLRRLR